MRSREIIALAFCLSSPAHADIGRLGAMGDSLSDEYGEETYGSYALNWTMQLKQYRSVTMGPTAEEAGAPGGTWGEPRREWYQSNWARSGATSATLLSQGQHTGLAGQVQGLGVTHAVVFIGANDFSPLGLGAYFYIYNGLWGQQQIQNYINGRIANVAAALDAVVPTGVRLVLVNFPDYGVAPPVWQNFLYSNADKREKVSQVIRKVNEGLDELARQRRVPLADFNALGVAIFGTNFEHNEFLKIGNVDIQLYEADTPNHGNKFAAFVDDGVHPHTTLQGVITNVILEGFAQGFDAGVAQFSEEEILGHGGITYGGSDTLESRIGPYRDYIRNYACKADCDGSLTLDVDDFICFQTAFAAGCP